MLTLCIDSIVQCFLNFIILYLLKYLLFHQGLSSGVFFDNLQDSFLQLGEYIAYGKEPDDIEQMERPTYNQIYADLTTTFTILIGIFFPSVTGNHFFNDL